MKEEDVYALYHVLLKRKVLTGYAYTINALLSYEEAFFLYNMYDNIHISMNGEGYTTITIV